MFARASARPNPCRMREALGLTWMPAPTSLSFFARSYTCTSNPARSSDSAAARPPMPPPMIAIESSLFFMGPEPDAVLASSVAPDRHDGLARRRAWRSHQSVKDEFGVLQGNLQCQLALSRRHSDGLDQCCRTTHFLTV